jgi:hypothetical protein
MKSTSHCAFRSPTTHLKFSTSHNILYPLQIPEEMLVEERFSAGIELKYMSTWYEILEVDFCLEENMFIQPKLKKCIALKIDYNSSICTQIYNLIK